MQKGDHVIAQVTENKHVSICKTNHIDIRVIILDSLTLLSFNRILTVSLELLGVSIGQDQLV